MTTFLCIVFLFVVLRQMAAKNPEAVEKFLKCLIEGIAIFKTNKPKTLAAVKKYMKGADDDILEESYQHTQATIDEAPYPSLAVVEQGLEMLSLQYPQAKQTAPALIIDPSFMKKIDDNGFVWALYKKWRWPERSV